GWIISLEKKGFELRRLNRILTFLSSLIGCIVFAASFIALSSALGYVSGLQEAIGPYLVVSSFGSGFANIVKLQMNKRQFMLNLKMRVEEEAEKVLKGLEDLQMKVERVKAVFRDIMIEDISSSISEMMNSLNFTLSTLDVMKITDLQGRLKEIEEYERTIDSMHNHLIKRAQDRYVRDYTKFKEVFIKASSLNIPQPIEIVSIDQKSIGEWDLDKIIEAQRRLYEDAKVNLSTVGMVCNEVYNAIQQNIDPDFILPNVEIARRFIEQGDLEKGAEIVIESLEYMDGKFGKRIRIFAQSIRGWLNSIKELLKMYVEPKVRLYPMVNLEAEMKLLQELELLISEIKDEVTIVEVVNLTNTQQRIVKFVVELIRTIDRTLRNLENEIDTRLPRGFDWGKDDQIHNLVDSIVYEIENSQIRLSEASFDLLNKVYKVLNIEVILLDRYLLEFELILNYPNVDSLISVKLKSKGIVRVNELPFNFPEHYMKLYSTFHKDTVFDGIDKSLSLIKARKEGA
ncbi:MAG: hypothetical protein RMJ31_06535, partial [Nitrososphaerota archaeon]|nr:hypothetical protein [Nitrososphaerota archaeon]